MTGKYVDLETSCGDVERDPTPPTKVTDKKDRKEWLLKTEDLQLWGPFSYRDLVVLSKGKKLTLYDHVAKSCGSFEQISDVKELQEIVATIPESMFDETTDKNIDREFSEITIRSSMNVSWGKIREAFNFSVIPLNTFLWVVLFFLVTSYCFYYVNNN